MKIETISTGELIPYARNAKKHDASQVAKLAGSIKEFGFNNPVLIDKDNGIIAGHGRIMAAQKLGLETVPCIRLDHLSDTQRRAYILADNRLAEIGGGWDEEMLKLELAELGELDVDLDGIGFGAEDLAELEMVEESKQNHPTFNVPDEIGRPTGLGPYHVKEAGIGTIALNRASMRSDYNEILNLKNNNPQLFSEIISKEIIELFSRPQPSWPKFDLVTIPPTSRPDSHPLNLAGEKIADFLGSKFLQIFTKSQKRKTRGKHAESITASLNCDISSKSILLLDDVITTGRTMRICIDKINSSGSHCRAFAWLTYG